jgi:CopG family transcriptional regulator, nickel-responsive regulator
MDNLKRFGVSVEKELVSKFDKHISSLKYKNRSEAIRDLIRNKLSENEMQNSNTEAFGIITITYDHHKRDIEKKLTSYQHSSFKSIVFTNHIHINHDNCLEIIVVKDKISKIKNLAEQLLSLKGVKNGKISLMQNL